MEGKVQTLTAAMLTTMRHESRITMTPFVSRTTAAAAASSQAQLTQCIHELQ